MELESSADSDVLPALRQGLEAVQIEHEGQPMVLLKDQEGLSEESLLLSLPGFLVATMLNGQTRITDLQSALSKATGTLISAPEIRTLIGHLEKADLLETASVKAKRKKIWTDFLTSPTRKAQHAGAGYPVEQLELASFLGKYFNDPLGPKKELVSAPAGPAPIGLFSPHIDFHRGGPAYAWAYQTLSKANPPDLIVALGVAHMSPNSPWVATRKTYETVYGGMTVDAGLFDEFKASIWYDPEGDQWAHRMEHSLEFQALWLRYLWRDKTPPWLPILASSFYEFSPDKPPSTVATIEAGIQKFGAALRKRTEAGQKILILAGVDLAHVGPRFGDEETIGPELNERIEREDREALQKALSMEADDFYMSAVSGQHWKKYCGLSAIYTGLRLMEIMAGRKVSGELLTYGQAADPLGGVVSFTSAIFARL